MGLSRHELFADQIKKCSTKSILSARVLEEREYLTSVYNTPSSLKRVFTTYRNQIRSPFYEHPTLPKRDVLRIVLEGLNLTREEIDQLNTEYKEQVVHDMSHLRFIQDVDGHIEKSIRLLNNRSYLDVIIGLGALTGRRMAEIGTSATFKIETAHTLIFEGQLKMKNRKNTGSYTIPVLHDSRLLVRRLKDIRLLKPELIGSPPTFHNRCSKELNRRVKRHYTDLYEDSLKPKDLRSIYAEICFQLHGAETMSRPLYYSKVLGHDALDVQTAQSYDDFRIKDPNFN
jgi:integrase